MNSIHILVVDDEEDIREILEFNLRGEGYNVTTAESAEEALTLDLKQFQLLVLDIMMNGLSGLHLATKIREEMKLDVPIIFLTAKDTENDLLTGFNLGADDYIKKPFSIKELLVRIRAVLTRTITTRAQYSHIIEQCGIKIDTRNKTIEIEGEEVKFTKKEFEILLLLMKNPGEVLSRAQILERVWPDGIYVLERTVDVHIARIRKKIGDSAQFITQRTGYGYCFEGQKE